MDEHQIAEVEITRETINFETARITWQELEIYYAGGNLISVSPELDLIDVAMVITNDDSDQLKEWTEQGIVDAVTDEQAQTFHESQATVWAVVIKPWILIQPINAK